MPSNGPPAVTFQPVPFPELEGEDKRTAEVLLSRHPLYGRVSRERVVEILRERAASDSTTIGVLWFYDTLRKYNTRHIFDLVRHSRLQPLVLISAVDDDRCCDFCQQVNGTVLPAADPASLERMPPYCIACRTGGIGLTAKQAARRNCAPFPRDIAMPDPDGACNGWVFGLTKYDAR